MYSLVSLFFPFKLNLKATPFESLLVLALGYKLSVLMSGLELETGSWFTYTWRARHLLADQNAQHIVIGPLNALVKENNKVSFFRQSICVTRNHENKSKLIRGMSLKLSWMYLLFVLLKSKSKEEMSLVQSHCTWAL